MQKLVAAGVMGCLAVSIASSVSTVSATTMVQKEKGQWQAGQALDRKPDGGSTKLTTALQVFNTQSLTDPEGNQQPPLTYEEVVAAIRLTHRPEGAGVSDRLFASFQRIARTGTMPAGATFEVLTSLDPGEDFVFDTWYVRLTLPKEDGGSYSFPLRSTIVRSHPVAEVARELEARLRKMPAFPGRYRLEERLQELKARANAAAATVTRTAAPQ